MPAVKLLEPGDRQRLDRYELVAELASGGMATVFLGRILGAGGFQRFVAIKRLHPHLAHEQEFVEMFLDEARLAAGIHHPNVVPILEVGTSRHGYYLVMEYIEGDTLARLLARAATVGEQIPTPIAVRIILDTLAGLHAAHELRGDDNQLVGLVHRDVSPQNVLVGVDGTSRITDFGVARAATRLSSTRAGQLKGKLAYMAPEQAKGGQIDRRADLFALGVILWEVLAGKRLFRGEGEADTLNRVLFEPIPKLRDSAPNVHLALEAVTMRALERDPNKRFPTAAEFADAIERAARVLQCIGSVRDVASYVQSVLGQEIAQQREAVRSWLAASEPSRTVLGGASGVSTGYASYEEVSETPSGSLSIIPGPSEDGRTAAPVDVHIDVSHLRNKPHGWSRWLVYACGAVFVAVIGAILITSTGSGAHPGDKTAASVTPLYEDPRAVPTDIASPVATTAPPVATDPRLAASATPKPPSSAGPASTRKAPIRGPAGATPAQDDIPLNPYR